MKLIIFSGAGDPRHPKYKPVYDIIIEEAQKKGYEDIHLQGWCGQESNAVKGFLSFTKAVKETIELLKVYEDSNKPYSVICRSFGCPTFLRAAMEIRSKNINFATLWGPPPFYTLFELFKGDVQNTISNGTNKGLILNEKLYEELYPIELLLREYDLDFNLKIALGTKDPYCTPAFADYLNKSFPSPKIEYRMVPEAMHEVREPNEEYFNALFN